MVESSLVFFLAYSHNFKLIKRRSLRQHDPEDSLAQIDVGESPAEASDDAFAEIATLETVSSVVYFGVTRLLCRLLRRWGHWPGSESALPLSRNGTLLPMLDHRPTLPGKEWLLLSIAKS